MRIRLKGRDGRPHCPLCRVLFVDDPEVYDCPGCETTYHADCASELGGCSTLGCPRMGIPPDAPDPDDQRLRTRFRRFRQGRRTRHESASRLRREHVEEAQQRRQQQAAPAAASSTTGDIAGMAAADLVVQGGCLLLECLAAAVVLFAMGLALVLAR